jgi:hypothetical protein
VEEIETDLSQLHATTKDTELSLEKWAKSMVFERGEYGSHLKNVKCVSFPGVRNMSRRAGFKVCLQTVDPLRPFQKLLAGVIGTRKNNRMSISSMVFR